MEDDLLTSVRRSYAEIAADPSRLWALCTDDIAFHVGGEHPLSGSYLGPAAVATYLQAVQQMPGDHAGFTVTSVLADTHRSLLLVEGTARNGDPAFVRTVVHVLRFRGDLLAEYWDHPFDHVAEDAFWCARFPLVPAQRPPRGAAVPSLGLC